MSGASIEMPKYRCHKEVWALQISGVIGHEVFFYDSRFEPIVCPADMFTRYQPQTGDYLVQYEGDGYRSFSPRAAFEAGYSRI